ncbi:C-type lectin domain family 4 member G-like isoform X1 [Rissa tridactyla]|uniref:C-type lectin domain family 4 member G-like isoform X1 n=1 Tax=Rissa tridactyla TaxID=75485 RepID=UPI0023BAEE62|nr:C-type lectin domain family 4 member G-like isoform X1 [Rissa tridactyla]
MSQSEGAIGTYEKWDFDEGTELEKREPRKAPKGALSPERAVALLYVLLALAFVLFTTLTIVSLQRVSAAWKVLEQARMRSENSHAMAWRNLSEVQRALDEQLSGKLKAIHGQLLNVSQEVENMRWKMTRCQAECGKELSDRLRVLEERDAPEPVLRQLAEVKQEQNRTLALLDAALEEARNLSEILCTRCPAGWQQFAKTCYFFSSAAIHWLAAKEHCTRFNAQLAVVNTEQENKFLANHIMENRVFWLGLTDMDKESNWQWVDGSSLTLTFWNSGEPNDAGHQGEDCATILPNGYWNDIPCAMPRTWICERSC